MEVKNLSKIDLFILALMALIFIFFLFKNNYDSENGYPDSKFIKQVQSNPKDRLQIPNINISAFDYYESYYANQIAFEKNLLDKPLLITGTVAEIRSGVFDTSYIDIDGSPNRMNKRKVIATLRDSQKDLAAKVVKGDVLQMICIGSDVTLGDLYVDDCIIYGIAQS